LLEKEKGYKAGTFDDDQGFPRTRKLFYNDVRVKKFVLHRLPSQGDLLKAFDNFYKYKVISVPTSGNYLWGGV